MILASLRLSLVRESGLLWQQICMFIDGNLLFLVSAKADSTMPQMSNSLTKAANVFDCEQINASDSERQQKKCRRRVKTDLTHDHHKLAPSSHSDSCQHFSNIDQKRSIRGVKEILMPCELACPAPILYNEGTRNFQAQMKISVRTCIVLGYKTASWLPKFD